VDADNAMAKQVLEVSVTANALPTLAAIDPVTMKIGATLEVQVIADDPDGDNAKLKYLLKDAPTGMQITAAGIIQWTVPSDAVDASLSVTIFTVDERDGLAMRVLEITLEPVTVLTLISAPTVLGPFTPEADAVIDEDAKTITIATAGGMRFYKLQSSDDTKLKITSIVIKEDKVLMSYKPTGE